MHDIVMFFVWFYGIILGLFGMFAIIAVLGFISELDKR